MLKQLSLRVSAPVAIAICLSLLVFSVAASAQTYDLGGNTVTFGLHGSLVTLFNSPEMMDKRLEAEELFNCKIEVLEIQHDAYEEAITQRLMSGESKYDVYTALGTVVLVNLMSQDALLPLDNYLPQEYLDKASDLAKGLMEGTRYKGSVYGFIPGSAVSIDMMDYIAYNKAMFEAAGAPDPYELYLAGNWTWETFTEVAKKLTADTDGDGAVDRWGIDVLPTIELVLSNDGRYVRNIDGKMTVTVDEPAVIQAFEQMDAWWQAGIFRGWGPEAFRNQQIGMLYMNHWVLRDQVNPATGSWNIDFDFGIVPMPKGPSATGYRGSSRLSNFAGLPANSAQPEALIALVDFLYPVEDLIDVTLESFKLWAPNREAYDVLEDSITEWAPATDPFYSRLTTDGWGAFQRGDKDWASYLASIKPEKQAALDDMFNN